MNEFKSDIYRIKAAVLFVVNQLGRADYHKLFKILYFADQKHLVRYGRPIMGDTYNALPYGPVPADVYDLFKHLASGHNNFVSLSQEASSLFQSFTFNRVGEVPVVGSIEKADMDELAPSDVACLQQAIDENKALHFNLITEKSHDAAWTAAFEKQRSGQNMDGTMEFVDIATAGGATDEMLAYIQENQTINQLLTHEG